MKTEIIRKLDKNYFLLRTHDGLGHFLEAQVKRLFGSEKNGLSRFLPKATIIENGGERSVSYQLTKSQAKTIRPLKSITHPELKALRNAAKSFYTIKKESTKFEANLRKAFYLPDPDLEPDAYYLWGSRKSPKLLVIWGIEKVPGTSLPIIVDSEQKEKNNPESVVSKLKRKVIRRTREWIMTATTCCLAIVGATLFMLSKDTSPPEVSEVNSINNPYYITITFDEEIDPTSIDKDTFKIRNTAHILTPSLIPEYPNKVILSLSQKLEDGEDYFLDFGLQSKPSDLAGNRLNDEQIRNSETLREFRFEDQIPPEIVEVEPLPPSSLIVRFSEAVSRRSAIRPSTFRLSNFRLADGILSEDRTQITLEFYETLVHNGSYVLEINELEDDSEYRNQLVDKIEFRYVDTFAPDLISTEEGASQSEIIIRFDECLDPLTALNPENYKVGNGVDILQVTPFKEFDDPKWGKGSFTAVRLVTSPLIKREEYPIEVTSIGDRMSPKNLMGAQSTTFSFNGAMDRSPPFITKVKGSQNNLYVEFSEILNFEKTEAENFVLRDLKRDKEVVVGSITKEIRGGSTLVRASLPISQYPGRLYHLSVKNCTDASGNESHLEKTYEARGLFREPIAIQVAAPLAIGESRIRFNLPSGVKWDSSDISKIEAYGISTTGGNNVQVEHLSYEDENEMSVVKLNLKAPLVDGSYQFYIEGAKLMDGTIVDRPYRGLVAVGS